NQFPGLVQPDLVRQVAFAKERRQGTPAVAGYYQRATPGNQFEDLPLRRKDSSAIVSAMVFTQAQHERLVPACAESLDETNRQAVRDVAGVGKLFVQRGQALNPFQHVP